MNSRQQREARDTLKEASTDYARKATKIARQLLDHAGILPDEEVSDEKNSHSLLKATVSTERVYDRIIGITRRLTIVTRSSRRGGTSTHSAAG